MTRNSAILSRQEDVTDTDKSIPKPTVKMRNGPASVAPSRADSVYAKLLQAINDGRFRAGDRVLEAEIAEWLMVSRTPVREALRRLESEDVLARGTQGLTVVEMTEEETLELYDLREVLEGAAAEFAVRNATSQDLLALQRALEHEEHCADENAHRLAAVNRDFHVALVTAAHNRHLSKTLNTMQDVFLRLPSTTFSMPGRPAKALAEHRRIVEAIERRDAPAAARAARAHIRQSRSVRLLLNSQVQQASEARELNDGPGKRPRIWR